MRMAVDAPSVLFIGDLDDPWVAAIADAIPGEVARRNCTDGPLFEEPADQSTVVIHRETLGPGDAAVMRDLSEAGRRVILCIGPHVRARDVDQFAVSADLVLPDATASETIARHVCPAYTHEFEPRAVLPLVAVVSSSYEVRRVLVDACEIAGFAAKAFPSWAEATPSRLAIWDAPVLEPDWDRALREAAQRRTVLALIGFADRRLVTTAREAGAAACLDFPCDMSDLAFVLDRLSTSPVRHDGVDPPHAGPPRPMGLRVVRPAVVDPRRGA
jgi:hypothetical protein